MAKFSYSFEIHEFSESLSPYGNIEVPTSNLEVVNFNDFSGGTLFRTTGVDNRVELNLEDRLLSLILDDSGSQTWNDFEGNRYTYFRRLLTKLQSSYPGSTLVNMISFGGAFVRSSIFAFKATGSFLSQTIDNVSSLQSQVYEDSVFDFAGVRIVRRTDRFPDHPSDGVIVAEGVLEAVKDTGLNEGVTYYYGIWTFNKNRHYSSGRFINIAPRDSLLPRGVLDASAVVRVLPGVERNDNVELLLNFSEKNGSTLFDSSAGHRHGTLSSTSVVDNFWLGDSAAISHNDEGKLKDGVGGRFNGVDDFIKIESLEGLSPGSATTSRPCTINFWIYPYAHSGEEWIMGTSNSVTTSQSGWSVTLQPDNTVDVVFGNNDPVTATSSLQLQTWSMVTIVYDPATNTVTSYLNGYQEQQTSINSFDSTGFDFMFVGGTPYESGEAFSGSRFFGVLHLISYEADTKGGDYILGLYNSTSPIFDKDLQTTAENAVDNGQREVLISWEVGEDFNALSGKVRVVRKYLSEPTSIHDGTVVIEADATPGEFFFLDGYDFVNNSNYHYRIFTVNALGNASSQIESRIVPVSIPPSVNSPAVPEIESVLDAVIISGDQKNKIQWTAPSDGRVVGTRIFYGTTTYPVVDPNDMSVTDGVLLADIPKDESTIIVESTSNLTQGHVYIHRDNGFNDNGSQIFLNNGEFHFYTLVTYDRLGRVSEPALLLGIPLSSSEEIFAPDDVVNLHAEVVTNSSVSLTWKNASSDSPQLDLYFDESALVIVNIQDIYGGELENITDLHLQACATPIERAIGTNERALCNSVVGEQGSNMVSHGARLDETCDLENPDSEVALKFSPVRPGLLKGLLKHTPDRGILAKRQKYEIDIRGQYSIRDLNKQEILFEFNTKSVRVNFHHPLQMSAINLLEKTITLPKNFGRQDTIRGDPACPAKNRPCDGEEPGSQVETFNGGYVNAVQPYICRVEVLYKGEPVPDGTIVNASVFRFGEDHPLLNESEITTLESNQFLTRTIASEDVDPQGNPTGRTCSKSVVDIPIKHPSLPDHVDVYLSLNHRGYFIDSVHTVRFVSNLKIETNIKKPASDGIEAAEQFANVYLIDPDNPSVMNPVLDGTLVKWDLIKLEHAKDRPFYGTEPIASTSKGVYSTTNTGIARNVFFGPVGDVENHRETITVCGIPELCCIGEGYAIRASVTADGLSATDAEYITYQCQGFEASTKNFLMNGATEQEEGVSISGVHYITYADGENMVKFQIARNPNTSEIKDADCFRSCAGEDGTIPFVDNHIIQITAPGEVLWNVVFDEDPYTGERTLVSYDSISAEVSDDLEIPFVANIPITGETTDFYVRNNKFIGNANPKPKTGSDQIGGVSIGSAEALNQLENLFSDFNPETEFKNKCYNILGCPNVITKNKQYENVEHISGTSTIIHDNKEVKLIGGGEYDSGILPVYIGFREPLDVRVIEARVNGNRVDELVIDGISSHTFTVEVRFAGKKVPDGTPVEVKSSGPNADVVIFNIGGTDKPTGGTVYTRQEEDASGTLRSYATFSVKPFPSDISYMAQIDVTSRYDKSGSIVREITKSIDVSSVVDDSPEAPSGPGYEDEPQVTPEKRAIGSNISLYNTELDSYDVVGNLIENRSGHFFVHVEAGTQSGPVSSGSATYTPDSAKEYIIDALYSFGGRDETNILPSSEFFDLATGNSNYTVDMPTPRAYGMTAVHDGIVYCIGGVEYDELLQEYKVSRKIESFNPITEKWNSTLSLMPDNYGVCWGSATVLGNFIYIFCGATSIIENSIPETMSDKILVYDIENDIWVKHNPSNAQLYKRITPFGFARTSPKTTTLSIFDGGDSNASSVNDGGTYSTGQYILGGSTTARGFMRFPVNILKGSHVDSFVVKFTVDVESGFADTPNIRTGYLDPDNANVQVLSDLSTDISDESDYPVLFTDPVISWKIGTGITVNDTFVTGDLSEIIQAFIERDGYEVGDHIVLVFLQQNASTRQYTVLDDSASLQWKFSNQYLYSGSFRKTVAQINAERQKKISDSIAALKASNLSSSYFLSLTSEEQNNFMIEQENRIAATTVISPYSYLSTGFKIPIPMFATENGEVDLSDTIDDEWGILPQPRDRGGSVYLPIEDKVYFIAGANQNRSTTLDTVESISLSSGNLYEKHTPLPRGLSLFGIARVSNDIYISGGFSSGHAPGWVNINLTGNYSQIEAAGRQSAGLLVTLVKDSGELVEETVRAIIRARLKIPAIDAVLTEFFATRLADRSLGGDGTGSRLDSTDVTLKDLRAAQNSLIDPNSDEFQLDASRRLGELLFLFPILFTDKEIDIVRGVGGTTLLPRSEDPYADLLKLTKFIKDQLDGTSSDETIGGLTKRELASLGDQLSSITLDPTVIDSGTTRDLYNVEITATLLDTALFGENISGIEFDILTGANIKLQDKINELTRDFYGISNNPLLLPHAKQPDIPPGNTPATTKNAAGLDASGQSLFSEHLIPTDAQIQPQSEPFNVLFYSAKDWVPQVRLKLTGGTFDDAIEILDEEQYSIPIGGSQLYDSIILASRHAAGEEFDNVKKVMYIASDNVQNLTFTTRDEVIDEVNSVDGDRRLPIIYTLFSTSHPNVISAQTDGIEVQDITKLANETGGQATAVLASSALSEVLNFAIANTTGAAGYGKYSKKFNLGEVKNVSSVDLSFTLPSNTNGQFRFRYTTDGFNYSNWSDWYSGSQSIDFVSFLASIIEIEIVLTTGFTIKIEEEYDTSPTGFPRFNFAKWNMAKNREDYLFVNEEEVLTNAQQVASAFEGTLPVHANVEIGVATSNSVEWADFFSKARPLVNNEMGKTFLLDRSHNADSVVPLETLTSVNQLVYSSPYGAWNPNATVNLYEVIDGENIPLISGFRLLPRQGKVYFDTRQSSDAEFKIEIINSDKMRVGLHLTNSSFDENIYIHGVGFIYSTNDVKPVQVSQAAPVAENLAITPPNPTSGDTITAQYEYRDINGDPEDGSIISWFKNNKQLFEIQGKTSWTSNILLPVNKLEPNDKITFSVSPSDGRSFGPLVFSPAVKVLPRAPSVGSITINASRNNILQNRFDTSSVFVVDYSFDIEDIGNEAKESGTEIKWFVNGQLFKTETFSEGDDPLEKKSVDPDFTSGISGLRAQQIGNTVYVEVIPKTSNITGEKVTSQEITVVNTIPIVSNINISPSSPTSSSDLEVTYEIDDRDLQLEGQTDQSTIIWEKSSGGGDFEEVSSLQGLTTIPSSETKNGEKWRVQIVASDGLDANTPVYSEEVTIRS